MANRRFNYLSSSIVASEKAKSALNSADIAFDGPEIRFSDETHDDYFRPHDLIAVNDTSRTRPYARDHLYFNQLRLRSYEQTTWRTLFSKRAESTIDIVLTKIVPLVRACVCVDPLNFVTSRATIRGNSRRAIYSQSANQCCALI